MPADGRSPGRGLLTGCAAAIVFWIAVIAILNLAMWLLG